MYSWKTQLLTGCRPEAFPEDTAGMVVSSNAQASPVSMASPALGSWKPGTPRIPKPCVCSPGRWDTAVSLPRAPYPRMGHNYLLPAHNSPLSVLSLGVQSTLALEGSPSHPVSTLLQTPHRFPTVFRINSRVLQLAWMARRWHHPSPAYCFPSTSS